MQGLCQALDERPSYLILMTGDETGLENVQVVSLSKAIPHRQTVTVGNSIGVALRGQGGQLAVGCGLETS